MTLPDNLYGVSAIDKIGVEYTFYGNGKAVASDDTEYGYKILSQDRTRMEYILTMIKGVEEIYTVLDYSSDVYTITFGPLAANGTDN